MKCYIWLLLFVSVFAASIQASAQLRPPPPPLPTLTQPTIRPAVPPAVDPMTGCFMDCDTVYKACPIKKFVSACMASSLACRGPFIPGSIECAIKIAQCTGDPQANPDPAKSECYLELEICMHKCMEPRIFR